MPSPYIPAGVGQLCRYAAFGPTAFGRDIRLALAALLLAGCAGVGVMKTSDAAVKLEQATELFDVQGRPLPAEPLIVAAIAEYSSRGDSLGLANGYRTYGLFFRTRTLLRPNYAEHYRTAGFLDRDAKYDERYERAQYYFEKAGGLLAGLDHDDQLSNIFFHMGDVALLQEKLLVACERYAQSEKAQSEYRSKHPSAISDADKRRFDNVLHSAMESAKCL